MAALNSALARPGHKRVLATGSFLGTQYVQLPANLEHHFELSPRID